ncbi:DNA-binding response regulator [Shewanella colwelliana]|uniref:response regulator transcription factor n=1 Tax=Shewanella colwelliana TaxID=23 RepID=UPI001BBEC255|nr:response regulator [Shewanella colwelliana]GIU33811.1 DNA-binding response regulator [Shewanella colwelliana]
MCDLYLVDDDQDVLDSLSWMLEALGHSTECYISADRFLASVDLSQPAIAILDIQMPGTDGIELLTKIKSANSPISVIMLTGHGTISMAVQAIQKGAIDFLEKPVDGDKLNHLLAKALEQTNNAFTEHNLQASIVERINTLTPRELQVMHKVLQGKLNKVIASELNIAQRTIELHRQKVMQKMQVSNIAELAYLMANCKV